jgi:hypothetical protein
MDKLDAAASLSHGVAANKFEASADMSVDAAR